MEQLFQLNIQTPTKAISMQTTNPEDVINMMKLSGQQVVSHDSVAIEMPVDVSSEECSTCGSEECNVCGMEPRECHQAVGEEYENTPDATRERNPRSHGDITDFGAPGTGRGQPGSALNKPSGHGDNPLTFEGLTSAYSKFKKSVAESYTGRETKDGVWRVFKTGNSVAVAGPFDCKEKASAWINKQKKSGTKVDEGYWQDAVKKAETDREARKGKSFEKNPASHDKNGVYKGDKDLAGNAVPKNKTKEVSEASNDYFKRRKDEEDRIAGTKAPAKKTPKQTDYEKKRKDQKVAEGSGSKEKQKTPYRDINSPEYKAAADKQKQRMAQDKAAEPGKKLLAKKGVAEGSVDSKYPHGEVKYRIVYRKSGERVEGVNSFASKADAQQYAAKDPQYSVQAYRVKQGVAEGLSKRDLQDVAAIKAAIEGLESQLKQPNADKAAIQQRIEHERKRLALYEQGMTEGSLTDKQQSYWDNIAKEKKNKERNALKAKKAEHEKTPIGKAEKYWGEKGVAAAQVNELSKGTLKSYSKAAGHDIHADQRDAGGARDQAAHSKKHGDTTAAANWDDEASWLDKRAEKRAGGAARATTKIAQKGVAEGSLNEGQYEMMMRNGQVKKFIAKDDADAKRIAAGHGAKSVIRLKGGVPAGKVSEQGVAEGSTATPGYIKYEQMKDKIAGVLIRLYNQGKDAETIEKMGERVAKHLGYNPADPVYQEAWLTSLTDASADGELDNVEDEDDYTDYRMRQGEMGQHRVAESATSKKKVTRLR